ncbi:Spindle assembly checkpoint component MAD1 [Lachnellula suecica]|uniref:Spindle assembly checkpoint component MAD1 n=1 Tax=Lachnellula suecica TaxID=602035 RepID=A0A8T9CGD5_9HELO|nr:Spindle assembly checkpoint component MAD1 [Lachnellula suecica]
MRSHTPQQSTDASRRRSSITGVHRTSMGSSIPRVQSRTGLARPSNSQPTYDFITGAEINARPPSRGAGFRQSIRKASTEDLHNQPNHDSEQVREKQEEQRRELDSLKADNKKLQYKIDNDKQEQELAKLRHESELRDARRKAEDDFKKMQAAESEKSKAQRQYDALLKEINEVRDTATNEKAALERRLREMEESKRILEEEVEDIKSEREESIRGVQRRATELETRNATLQRSVEELQEDSDKREALLQEAQQQLSDKEKINGNLEADILRLKAQTGDVETLGIIKRELSEQVTHIRTLEAANRDQAAELKHFKRLHKSVEVVEEEKRSLQRKLESLEGLENDLGEAKIQRQRLEDERLAWTAYLQSQAGADGELEFDSPEALARALVEERMQNFTLVERLGAVETESSEKDVSIQGLEAEKVKLSAEMEKLKTTSAAAGSNKIQLRLERQRALAIKEAEYLRAQLKTYDTEDTTFQPETVDEAKVKRISELEDMVEQYRQEVQTLHTELESREKSTPQPTPETVGSKRPRDESEDNERVGQLSRKNRKLQEELSKLQTNTKVLQKELSVAQERLTIATQQSKTRVLSLRSNPTSDVEAIKMATLNGLRKENADLLAQLEGSSVSTVPASQLEALRRDVQDAEDRTASEKKRNDRLMKVWADKSAEFRLLITDLLGWDVMFMKNMKTRVTSVLYPGNGDDENSIEFDGQKGTMKVTGGPESAFAVKIGDQLRFWVRERGSIPCFLAALTLEFWEEKHGDRTLQVAI